MTVAFYVWDDKLEWLWRDPERQTAHLLAAGVGALIEPDFSLWTDAPLVEQLWNTYRTRWLGRYWQEAGLAVIPNLNWAGPDSYEFCFQGIPQHPPVVACECRTAGQTDDDRRAFLVGLSEGVKQVAPQTVIVYGGADNVHASWLTPCLPPGPRYVLLPSWTALRDRRRTEERRRERARNQIVFNFPSRKESTSWAAGDPVAAVATE